MKFCVLRDRLLARIRGLLETGAISESQLARHLGVSQPHLHNTLKGVRGVTTQMADQFLESMGWSIADLLEPVDFEIAVRRYKASVSSRTRFIEARPLSSIRHPPSETVRRIAVPRDLLRELDTPAAYFLEAQDDGGWYAKAGDVLLIDRQLNHPAPNPVYVIERQSAGPVLQYAIRSAAFGVRACYTLEPAAAAVAVGGSTRFAPPSFSVLLPEQIIGRIHAICHSRSGTFQRPVPLSDAS